MKKIFLAEDDADDQDIFREIVEAMGEEIALTIAENGEDLLQLLNTLETEELPDLLLLDQNMPRLKGTDTIDRLRKSDRFRDLPVVIYTTYHDSKFATFCEANGIELFLKPDTFNELSKLIHDLVDKYLRQPVR